MGTFSVDVEIGDPDGREFVVVNALVDTGATYTALPESLLQGLGVQPRADRRFRLADDGRVARLPLGVTVMRLMGEEWPVYVIFAPDESTPCWAPRPWKPSAWLWTPTRDGSLLRMPCCFRARAELAPVTALFSLILRPILATPLVLL